MVGFSCWWRRQPKGTVSRAGSSPFFFLRVLCLPASTSSLSRVGQELFLICFVADLLFLYVFPQQKHFGGTLSTTTLSFSIKERARVGGETCDPPPRLQWEQSCDPPPHLASCSSWIVVNLDLEGVVCGEKGLTS